MMYKNLLAAIGNTPIVKIDLAPNQNIYAKLEYLNPGGSIKDRSALYMIEQAEQRGDLQPGGVIVDASSGNHAISVAMIGAIKGYKVIMCVSEKISQEKLATILAYGAEVVMCKPTAFLEHPESYHSRAVAIHKATPGSFMPNQYFNIENTAGHYASLGPEIWRQTDGKITHFIAATGTGGTASGAGKYLKEQNPNIKVIGVDSAHSFKATNGHPQPYKVEGMGIDFNSPVLDYSVIDEFVNITDEQALGFLQPLAREHGLLVGTTSGAVAYAAQQYMKTQPDNSLAVFICGDSGRAYLTKNFY